jgi:hypothetical protein
MNTAAADAWPQLLQFVTDTLKDGKDFTVEQAPKVVQEFLRWYTAESIFWIVLWLVLGAIWWVVSDKIAKAIEVADDAEDAAVAKLVMRIGGAIIVAIIVGNNAYCLVKVTVAPRIVLIEYARAVIGGR